MYNRYIRNEHGEYKCIPVVSPPRPAPRRPASSDPLIFSGPGQPPPGPPPFPPEPPPPPPPAPPPFPPGAPEPPPPPPVPPPPLSSHLFGQLLERFHLNEIDTGDLLLLLILFLLFEEKADDEILIALGLLLIL